MGILDLNKTFAWSPGCINFAPIYSKLSADYGLPNFKFGKFLIENS